MTNWILLLFFLSCYAHFDCCLRHIVVFSIITVNMIFVYCIWFIFNISIFVIILFFIVLIVINNIIVTTIVLHSVFQYLYCITLVSHVLDNWGETLVAQWPRNAEPVWSNSLVRWSEGRWHRQQDSRDRIPDRRAGAGFHRYHSSWWSNANTVLNLGYMG